MYQVLNVNDVLLIPYQKPTMRARVPAARSCSQALKCVAVSDGLFVDGQDRLSRRPSLSFLA